MRTHTEINTGDQEPWSYGEEFERINRATIELRYALLPYLYGVMRQAAETGIPAMRPMILEHPRSGEAIWDQEQFYFGDHLLVAPVLWPGETTRRAWLPEGLWYDFWEGTAHSGGKWITLEAPLERIPIMGKAGGVVPMQPVVQYVGEKPADPLTLLVFSADSAISEYYEDDGLSFEYRKGVYAKRIVEQSSNSRMHTIRVSAQEGSYQPPRQRLEVKVMGIEERPKGVEAFVVGGDGRSLLQEWTYDQRTKSVSLLVREQPRAWEALIRR
jgi:alpha-glucosidase